VVLDLGLPDLDGRDVLAMLRAVDDVPVIVATARDGDPEIVAVLEAGADDYLVKRFSGAQLHARIGVVGRPLDDRCLGTRRSRGHPRARPLASGRP
jgi:DNA-binding response OmpR family regulator